jgi:hypothetical protein
MVTASFSRRDQVRLPPAIKARSILDRAGNEHPARYKPRHHNQISGQDTITVALGIIVRTFLHAYPNADLSLELVLFADGVIASGLPVRRNST